MSFWSRNLPARSDNAMTLQKEINDFFEAMMKDSSDYVIPRNFLPKVEVKEDEKTYHVSAEVPGMKEEDIHLTMKDNTLIIEGEKKNENRQEAKGRYHSEFTYGSFYRSLPFANQVNEEKIAAVYKNGILEVTLEKAPEAAKGTRKISIKKA